VIFVERPEMGSGGLEGVIAAGSYSAFMGVLGGDMPRLDDGGI
jgi:hypothetical protein